MNFFNRLNYSLGNEDWHTEEQALRIKPNDIAICVTASGDRPLHLLMTDCAQVISIDMNQIQNFLLEIKLAAITQLNYDTYLEFLGVKPTKHRYAIFTTLKNNLSKDAIHFWENNKKMIQRGIAYQGKVERVTYVASIFLRLLRYNQIKKLFSFNDVSLQRDFIENKWDSYVFRKIFYLILNPNLMKILINDPGMISYIDPSIKPGVYIYNRMVDYLNRNLAKKSPLLQLLMTGKISSEAYFPYLTYQGYTKIRENTARLSHKTVNIIEHISHSNPNSINCFSMSDIASYMSQESFNQLLEGMYHAAKPGARFCLRKLMSNHTMPEHLINKFQRDHELEKKLEKEESNFVYQFMVGQIEK